MEAKVDSMQPQESCGHKIYQDSSTLEEKAVSMKHCNTFEKVISTSQTRSFFTIGFVYSLSLA
jgi:hypothetical protein